MEWILIILGWLLFNTWTTLILMRACQVYCESWVDLGCMAIMAIITPWPFLLLRWIKKLWKRG